MISETAREKQNYDDEQEEAYETVAAIAKAVAGPAEPAAETAQQEDDEDNDKDGPKRHDRSFAGCLTADCRAIGRITLLNHSLHRTRCKPPPNDQKSSIGKRAGRKAANGEVVETFEGKRWPEGKEPGGKG